MRSQIKLTDLNALLRAVQTIRELTPNTGNAAEFKAGLQNLSDVDLHELAQAIDTANLAAKAIELTTAVEVKG